MFDNLVNSLKKNDSSDNEMYTMIITISAARLISASQVVQLLKFLLFHDDKLELAKMAYGYVLHQDSYDGIIDKAFLSSDTKANLNEYIHRHW